MANVFKTLDTAANKTTRPCSNGVHLLVRKSENQQPKNIPLSIPSHQKALETCLQLNTLGLLTVVARRNTHHGEP